DRRRRRWPNRYRDGGHRWNADSDGVGGISGAGFLCHGPRNVCRQVGTADTRPWAAILGGGAGVIKRTRSCGYLTVELAGVAAVLNVQAAQAQYRIQRADLFPTVAASAVEQIQKYPSGVVPTGGTGGGSTGAAATPFSGGTTIRFFEAGVGFTSYEIDLFGKV